MRAKAKGTHTLAFEKGKLGTMISYHYKSSTYISKILLSLPKADLLLQNQPSNFPLAANYLDKRRKLNHKYPFLMGQGIRFIFPSERFNFQGISLNTQGMALNLQGMILNLQGMTLNDQGMTFNLQGMTLNSQGMALNLQGMTFQTSFCINGSKIPIPGRLKGISQDKYCNTSLFNN